MMFKRAPHPLPPALCAFVAVLVAGCSLPTLKIATPEPIKVDLNMRVDVYSKDPVKTKPPPLDIQAAESRRNRMEEVQKLKNDGVIGENRLGFLEVRRLPENDPKYEAYIKTVVQAENADRTVIYIADGTRMHAPVDLIERQYAQLWRDRAFPGEWIQQDNGTWVQKK